MKVRTVEIISSAHSIPWYPGKCREFHGHNWKIEVEVEGDIHKDRMVVDFSILKREIQELDHKVLNTFVPNPTSENLSE